MFVRVLILQLLEQDLRLGQRLHSLTTHMHTTPAPRPTHARMHARTQRMHAAHARSRARMQPRTHAAAQPRSRSAAQPRSRARRQARVRAWRQTRGHAGTRARGREGTQEQTHTHLRACTPKHTLPPTSTRAPAACRDSECLCAEALCACICMCQGCNPNVVRVFLAIFSRGWDSARWLLALLLGEERLPAVASNPPRETLAGSAKALQSMAIDSRCNFTCHVS